MMCFAKLLDNTYHCELCDKRWNAHSPAPVEGCDPSTGDLINYIQKQQERIDDLTIGYNKLREQLAVALRDEESGD